MANALFAWRNRFTTGTLTASDAVGGLGVANLAGDQGSPDQGWQTPAGTLAAWVLLDSGVAAAAWRAFAVARTNLSGAAQIRWRVGSSPGFEAGTVAYDSGTVPAGVVAGIGQSVTIAAAPVVGRYCRLDLADPTNPQGFINVALAYAGEAWQLAGNAGTGSTFGRTDQSNVTQTRGGQQYPNLYASQRRFDVDVPSIRLEEESLARELDRVARAGGNVLFVPNLTSGSSATDAVLGILTPKSDFSFPAPTRRAWKASILERF